MAEREGGLPGFVSVVELDQEEGERRKRRHEELNWVCSMFYEMEKHTLNQSLRSINARELVEQAARRKGEERTRFPRRKAFYDKHSRLRDVAWNKYIDREYEGVSKVVLEHNACIDSGTFPGTSFRLRFVF